MLAIVCGAGLVGRSLVSYLVDHKFDVAVIDNSARLIADLTAEYDVRAIVGHAAHPDDLERAGASDAQIIFAFTRSDEVNMIACQIAHSLYQIQTKIARVRSSAYTSHLMDALFTDKHIPIDQVLAPEEEVAREMMRCILNPGVFSLGTMIDGRVAIAGIKCCAGSAVAMTALRQLATLTGGIALRVLAIVREDGQIHYPTSRSVIMPGDDVFTVLDCQMLPKVLQMFGHDDPAPIKHVVIVGTGLVGQALAHELLESNVPTRLVMIEADQEKALAAAERFPTATVLHGDALSAPILAEANIRKCDVAISVTSKDETNLFACLLAKHGGARRAVSIINSTNYLSLLGKLGIDVPIYPREVVISSLLRSLRRNAVRDAHSLRDGFAEILDIEIVEGSSVPGQKLGSMDFPDGVVAGLIMRANKLIVATNKTILEHRDRLILVADRSAIAAIERMFAADRF